MNPAEQETDVAATSAIAQPAPAAVKKTHLALAESVGSTGNKNLQALYIDRAKAVSREEFLATFKREFGDLGRHLCREVANPDRTEKDVVCGEIGEALTDIDEKILSGSIRSPGEVKTRMIEAVCNTCSLRMQCELDSRNVKRPQAVTENTLSGQYYS